jgi:hypothetical protein
LSGLGKLKVKDSPAREGRNPSTGSVMQITASKKLSFAPAKAVKDKLNGRLSQPRIEKRHDACSDTERAFSCGMVTRWSVHRARPGDPAIPHNGGNALAGVLL